MIKTPKKQGKNKWLMKKEDFDEKKPAVLKLNLEKFKRKEKFWDTSIEETSKSGILDLSKFKRQENSSMVKKPKNIIESQKARFYK